MTENLTAILEATRLVAGILGWAFMATVFGLALIAIIACIVCFYDWVVQETEEKRARLLQKVCEAQIKRVATKDAKETRQ